MGIYVIVGAGLLGVSSCVLIVWSLWTRKQARERARARQLASVQQAGQTGGGYPLAGPSFGQAPGPSFGQTVVAAAPSHPAGAFADAGADEQLEPRTQFMTTAELFGRVDAPDEPTQFLSDEELFDMQGGGVELELEPEPEPDDDPDEPEIATAFMSTEELFARAGGKEPSGTVVLGPAKTDATVVLADPSASTTPKPFVAKPFAPKPYGIVAKPKPSAHGFVGFVGDRANDDDDADDDFDDDDPETELVHQAELLRLIAHNKPQ